MLLESQIKMKRNGDPQRALLMRILAIWIKAGLFRGNTGGLIMEQSTYDDLGE